MAEKSIIFVLIFSLHIYGRPVSESGKINRPSSVEENVYKSIP